MGATACGSSEGVDAPSDSAFCGVVGATLAPGASVETVEQGQMTKDLAILIGPDQPWMTTEQFFEAVRVNLEAKMASWA